MKDEDWGYEQARQKKIDSLDDAKWKAIIGQQLPYSQRMPQKVVRIDHEHRNVPFVKEVPPMGAFEIWGWACVVVSIILLTWLGWK